MTASTELDAAAARRALRRMVKAGGLLIPANSAFGRIAFKWMSALLEDGNLQACRHLSDEQRIDPGFVPTYFPMPFVVFCPDCFTDNPMPSVCQVCFANPSVGLRTVITRDPANAGIRFVGRLCRECRPGRIS